MVIPATSTEYVHVPVAPLDGVDLTGSPPRIAILASTNHNNPTDDDWHTGAWADGTVARLLIGPDGGAIELARGGYSVWTTFDPPGSENIVRRAGHLTII